MKALVIYDSTGKIWSIFYGEDQVPQGLLALFVDIPDGGQLERIDVTNPDDPKPVFTYLPESDIGKLQNRVTDLENQLTEAQLTEQKLQQLRELSQSLNYADYDDNYERVTADVIATDGSNLFNVFTVNAGKDDGVTAGSIVVNEDGLVGKVVTVGKNWAKVLGIVDASDSVSFTLLRDPEVIGVLSGDGEGGLTGYLFDEEKSLNKGDILITSGMSLYPAGITIGKVASVEYDESSKEKKISVESQVNFKAVRTVTILIGS